jgi:hypothetical protein
VLLRVAAGTTGWALRTAGIAATAFVWFTFVAQIFISEFLNYHPGIGWLNQPLVQLPWFHYVPGHLQNPWGEPFGTLLFLVLVWLGWRVVKKWRSVFAR